MNCDYVKANAVSLVYEELADDLRFEMERHVERCAACAAEVGAIRHLQDVMSSTLRPEPTPNLLAASRIRLQEALEEVEHKRGWQRFFTFDLAGWMRQVKMAPALSMALIILGFATGTLTTWRLRNTVVPGTRTTVDGTQEATIGGIRNITQDPVDASKVLISYDTVTRQQ